MSIKGQSLYYDFFIALSIFLVSAIFVFSLWKVRVETLNENLNKRNREIFLIDVSDIWFREGYPEYWSLENLIELGLSNDGMINSTKVELLNSFSYTKFLEYVKAGKFKVKYEVFDANGNKIYEYPNILLEGKNVVFIDRYAIWNESLVKVRSIVWD